MDIPLYDREIDATPPARKPGAKWLSWAKGKAPKGRGGGWLVRWFAGLSFPGLVGLGLIFGVLVSTPVAMLLRPRPVARSPVNLAPLVTATRPAPLVRRATVAPAPTVGL